MLLGVAAMLSVYRYKTVDKAVPVPVAGPIAVNTAGMIVQWSCLAEKLTGYREQDVVGKEIYLLAEPSLWQEQRQLIARHSAGTSKSHVSIEILSKDNKVVLVDLCLGGSEFRFLGLVRQRAY
jgi:PAS domain S-box-containing protein